MKNKKIAQIVCTYPPYSGGMGNVASEVSKRLRSRGHEVTVFTPKYRLVEEKENIERLEPKFSYGNAAYLPQLKGRLSGFDLVHLHYPFYGAAEVVYKWKQTSDTPLVLSYHMDNIAQGIKGVAFNVYRYFYLKKILNSANGLTCSSFEYIKNSDASRHFENNKEKWHEVPFGVDLDKFRRSEAEEIILQKHSSLKRGTKTILFVGGMDEAHYFKGVPILLNALKRLKGRGMDFQALLVGEGELKTKYIEKAKGFGLSDFVTFTGFVKDRNLSSYYTFADVTVLPSVNMSEAFGLVLLESMACGTPVVASDLPGVRTIAKQGGGIFKRGNSKDLYSTLDTILNDTHYNPEDLRKVVKEQYTWNKSIDKLEEVYSSLFEEI